MQINPFASAVAIDRFPLMLRQAACRRGDVRVLSGLDLMIDAGDAWVVRGANGRGKTTLLRLLAGLSRPADGVVTWGDGASPRQVPERAIMIGHADALKPALTVAENLDFWSGFAGRTVNPWPGDCDPFAVCALADLPVRVLSAGQRRRVSLTRLGLTSASLWLLDEPTTALDAAGQQVAWALIAAHRRRGGAVVVTTHAATEIPDAKTLDLGAR